MGLSSKFRIGQVAGALSSGLGLFAEKKWKEEREAEERAWQEHLQKVADMRAQARDDLEWQRTLAANAQRFAVDAQNRASDRQYDATQRNLDRRARREEFGMRMDAETADRHRREKSDRRAMLEKTLIRIDERYEDQRSNPLAALDAEKLAALDTQYKEERDRAIGSYVQSMMQRAQEFPELDAYSEFRVNSRDEIAGLLETEGATYEGADKIADRWMKWMSDPGADEAGAGTRTRPGAAGGDIAPYIDGKVNPAYIEHVRSREQELDAAIQGGSPPPPTGPAAQVDPTPKTPMPESVWGSGTQPLWPGVQPEPQPAGPQPGQTMGDYRESMGKTRYGWDPNTPIAEQAGVQPLFDFWAQHGPSGRPGVSGRNR